MDVIRPFFAMSRTAARVRGWMYILLLLLCLLFYFYFFLLYTITGRLQQGLNRLPASQQLLLSSRWTRQQQTNSQVPEATVAQILFPVAIGRGGYATIVPVSKSVHLALTSPAETVRQSSGLLAKVHVALLKFLFIFGYKLLNKKVHICYVS